MLSYVNYKLSLKAYLIGYSKISYIGNH